MLPLSGEEKNNKKKKNEEEGAEIKKRPKSFEEIQASPPF